MKTEVILLQLQGDPKVSEEHRAADKEAAVPEARQGDRTALQGNQTFKLCRSIHSILRMLVCTLIDFCDVLVGAARHEVPEPRGAGTAGGGGGVPGGSVRGHQPLRHPLQARHHHVQRRSARQEDPWREALNPALQWPDSYLLLLLFYRYIGRANLIDVCLFSFCSTL